MSNCYKCGCELPDGQVECEPGCAPQNLDADFKRIFAEMRRHYHEMVEIDWDKVQTVEDLKLIVRVRMGDFRVHPDSESFKTLKRFLKGNHE